MAERERGVTRHDHVPCFWCFMPCCCGTAERRFNVLQTAAEPAQFRETYQSVPGDIAKADESRQRTTYDLKITVDTWRARMKRLFTRWRHRREEKYSVGGQLRKGYDEKENSRRVNQILVRSDVRAGNALEDHYEYVCHLGAGKYGSVERWRTREGRGQSCDVAVKKIKWSNVSSNQYLSMRCLVKTFDKDAIKNVENELRMFLELDNPFIVKGREWFEHSWKGIFFVMEFLDGETLQEFLDEIIDNETTIPSPRMENNMLPPEQINDETEWQTLRRMFNHMCYAVSYMHSKNIIHRDLKPDNVMLVKDQTYRCVKLIDFGLSEVCHEDAMGLKTKGPVIVGTLTFMSPELLQMGAMQTKACDMWAMGVILIWMVSSCSRRQLIHPFSPSDMLLDGFISPEGSEFFYLMDSFEQEPYWNKSIFSDLGLDDAFYEVADGLLDKDPSRRMEAEGLLMSNFVHAAVARHETRLKSKLTGSADGDGGSILESIRSYTNLSKFDQAILSVMAEHISPLEVMNIQRIFRRMDTDQNGKLSRAELLSAFAQVGAKLSKEDQEAIDILFEGGKKDLDYSDWVATEIANSILSDEATAQHAFWSLDTSGTGNLTLDDLVVVVGATDARAIFEDFNKEDNDVISFEEFQEIIGEMVHKRASVVTGTPVGRRPSISDMRKSRPDALKKRDSIQSVVSDSGMVKQVSDERTSGSNNAKKAAKIMNVIRLFDDRAEESMSDGSQSLRATMPALSHGRACAYGIDLDDEVDDAESLMKKRKKALRRVSTTKPPERFQGKKNRRSWAMGMFDRVRGKDGTTETTSDSSGFSVTKLKRRQTVNLEAPESTTSLGLSTTSHTTEVVENTYKWERPDIDACLILQDR